MSGKALTRSQLKHQAILEAAMNEFREAGFLSTSMDRIAERAAVSKRTVYNHFQSKEGLFRAIVELLFRRSREATDIPYDPEIPIRQQLEDLAKRELEMLADTNYIGLARTLMAEAIRSPALLQESWPEVEEREVGMPAWLRAAVEDGQLDIDEPELAARQLVALIKAFAFWPQVIKHEPPPDAEQRRRVIDGAVSMFLARYHPR
jgi:TetR/AcrR family transcriptional regulator of autoinduction and epiphytic fitness